MRRLLSASIPILISACSGTDNRATDAAVHGDSGPGDGGVTATQCKLHKHVDTQPGGARTEAWSYFLPIAATPGTDIEVVLCDPVSIPPATGGCSSTGTCTDSGDPLPAGRTCQVVRGILNFSGDTAVVSCGYEYIGFNASGVETSHQAMHYTSAEIRR